MAIIRWDPFREFRPLFTWPFERETWTEEWLGAPALDISEDEKNVIIKADLPGLKPEEVDITVTKDSVTIKGEHKEEKEEKGKKFLRRERRVGRYARTISLPAPIIPDKAKAEFEDGTLTVTIPKTKEAKPEQVKVKVKKGK